MIESVMKKIVIMVLLCLPAMAYAQPSIDFASEIHNFGFVTQGERVEYAFEFANKGTEDLVIERLASS